MIQPCVNFRCHKDCCVFADTAIEWDGYTLKGLKYTYLKPGGLDFVDFDNVPNPLESSAPGNNYLTEM